MLTTKRLKAVTGLDGNEYKKFVAISTSAILNKSDKEAANVVVRILQTLGYPGPYEIKGEGYYAMIKCGEDTIRFHSFSHAFGIVFDLLKVSNGNKTQIRYMVRLRDSEIELIEESYITVANDRTVRYGTDRTIYCSTEYKLTFPEKVDMNLLDHDIGKEPVSWFTLEIRHLDYGYFIPRNFEFEAALYNQQDFSQKAIYALLKKYYPEYNFKKHGVEIEYSSQSLHWKITVRGDKCIGLVLKQDGEHFEINSEQVVFQNDNTSYICSETCLKLQTNNRDKHAELKAVEDRIREMKKKMKKMLG